MAYNRIGKVRGMSVSDLTTVLADEAEVGTLTGELVAIDFARRQITLRYRPTQLEVVCPYSPESEELLLLSRRALVQVTGEVEFDAAGHPRRVAGVRSVAPVDLGPVALSRIELDGRVLHAAPPLDLRPRLDEGEQLYLIDDADLDLHVFAPTRAELLDEVARHLFYAWDAYVLDDPERLTPAARHLAAALRRRLRESPPGDGETA